MIELSVGDWTAFLIMIIALTFAIFLRYALLASVFYYVFNIKNQFPNRRLSQRPINRHQIKLEIGYSLVSSFIFALFGTALYWKVQSGDIRYSTGFGPMDLIWIVAGLILIMMIHETYYYWLHRWMHLPHIYKYVHKAHHESLTTTAWTSFSFHPIESFLQGLPLFILFYLIPFHAVSLILSLIIMAITSVINHLNTEVYNHRMGNHWLGKWWIGATHHHLHHSQFRFNYGLYFTFWDHWMKTESPDFEKLLAEKLNS